MVATSLNMFADRLASQLSGGNQRKLSLAIALIGKSLTLVHALSLTHLLAGNPSVVLIDEFSTGIDAKMKRDMWGTLRSVAVGKAVVITTRASRRSAVSATILLTYPPLARLYGRSVRARKQGRHHIQKDAR